MSNAETTVTAVVDRVLSSSLLLSLTRHAPPAKPLRRGSDLPVVTLIDPAVRVMTDFRQECAITVAEDRPIGVVEATHDRSAFVRGVISRTRLERQLGAQRMRGARA